MGLTAAVRAFAFGPEEGGAGALIAHLAIECRLASMAVACPCVKPDPKFEVGKCLRRSSSPNVRCKRVTSGAPGV